MRLIGAEPIIEELYKIGNEKDEAGEREFALGIDTVIYLLEQDKTVDAVIFATHKQIARERDLAMHQLEEYGIGFGEIFNHDKCVLIEEAIEKQEYQKPYKDSIGIDSEGNDVYVSAYCPICKHEFEIGQDDWMNYCPKCEQKLDWSEVE